MKLRCAIIDDEPLAVSLLENYVGKTDFLTLVSTYTNAIQALNGIKEEPVDLLFLDIQMPELSGLELAKLVDNDTRIIFTTAFSQYALEGFRANALDYLLKPISYADFLQAATKAQQWFELSSRKQEEEMNPEEKPTFFYVKSEYRQIRIEMKDIIYIEGLKDYVKIYLTGQSKAILSLLSMRALEDFLPASMFKRVHRSFIINLNKIAVVERGRIVFGDTYIPISDSNREMIQTYINQHSIL